MQVTMEVPEYYPEEGIRLVWDDWDSISVKIDDYGSVVLAANGPGLRSLARHMLTLAQDTVPPGCHVHLDDYNSLEKGSSELILVKS